MSVRRRLRRPAINGRGVPAPSRDEIDADHLRLPRLDRVRQLPEPDAQMPLLPFHLHRLVLLPTTMSRRTLILIHALVDSELQLPAGRRTLRNHRWMKSQQNRRLVIRVQDLAVDRQMLGLRAGGRGDGEPADELEGWRFMDVFELLETVLEPALVHQDLAIFAGDDFAVEGVLEADVASVLLAEEGADYGAFLSSESVSCDIVGYGEEDERVEEDLETGVGGFVSG